MTRQVSITLSEQQAQDLILVLDTFVRLGLGQLQIVEELVRMGYVARLGDKTARWPGEKQDCFRAGIAVLKQQLGLQENESMGVGHPALHPAIHRVTDLHDTLRHALSWARQPAGGWTVNFDEPMHYGNEPLPVVDIR